MEPLPPACCGAFPLLSVVSRPLIATCTTWDWTSGSVCYIGISPRITNSALHFKVISNQKQSCALVVCPTLASKVSPAQLFVFQIDAVFVSQCFMVSKVYCLAHVIWIFKLLLPCGGKHERNHNEKKNIGRETLIVFVMMKR